MAEYRVDDLARAAGTTVGNVRVYQDRELLPPPRKRGRVALYSDAHLARLRMVRGLLERGYTFAQIREIITTWESGRDLADLLGLDGGPEQPWSDEVPERLPLTEVLAEFGDHITPEISRRAARLGLYHREGDDVLIPSPRLLHTTRQLLAAGVPMSAILDLAEQIQEQTDRLADLCVRMADSATAAPGTNEMPGFTERVTRLRPLAQSTTSAFLARSMSRAINNWVTRRFGSDLGRDYPGGG